MDKSPVAITIRSFNRSGPAMRELEAEFSVIYTNLTGARLSERDLIAAVKDAEYVIAGTEIFSKHVIDCSKKLRAISRVGVGTDSIDLQHASRRNIQIFNTPEAPVISVTEHTLALLLAILKRIPQYNQNVRDGDYSVVPGLLLSGKVVGIIGFGRIGQRFASVLTALGCKIQYYDPFLKSQPQNTWKSVPSLEDLVKTSDIISLHASPSSNGSPLINSSILKNCKKGQIIINTARGTLIDESALELAIQEGVVASVGLDVFSNEPYSGTLLKYPQVIVTPHVASNTVDSRIQMEMEAVKHIIEAKRKERK